MTGVEAGSVFEEAEYLELLTPGLKRLIHIHLVIFIWSSLIGLVNNPQKSLPLNSFLNKYNHTINIYTLRTLPFPAMKSLLVIDVLN